MAGGFSADFTAHFGKSFIRRKSKTTTAAVKELATSKSKDLKNPREDDLPYFPGDYEIFKCELHSVHKPGAKGSYIDLRQSFSDLNIYEDIFSPALQMDITIVDGTGLEEFLPIIGEETIHLEIQTANMKSKAESNIHALEGPEATAAEGPPPKPGPFAESENPGLLKLKFQIYKMSDKVLMDDVHGQMMYKLHGVSEEYIENCKKKVQRSTLNPITKEPRKISNVVRSLYKEFFRRSPKKIFIEPTKNLTSMIIPNLTPFKSFEFLASRAVSAGQHAVGASFVFFETTTGFHFVSLETLMSGGGMGYINPPDDPVGTSPQEGQYTMKDIRSKETYTIWPKHFEDTSKSREEHAAMEAVGIEEYQFISNFDVLENLTKGMYANKLLTHDLVRMKYDVTDFNYILPMDARVEKIVKNDGSIEEIDKVITAQDKKNFADGFSHLDAGELCTIEQTALGSPDAHVSFYPTSLGHDSINHFKNGIGIQTVKHGAPMGPLNIVPNRVEQWMQQRIVQQQQINNIKVNVRAPGRSCRMVGDVIDLKLPTPSLKDRGAQNVDRSGSEEHKYLSGKYLITKLKHNFKHDRYTIDFEAIKDSIKEPWRGGNLTNTHVVNAPDTNDASQTGVS